MDIQESSAAEITLTCNVRQPLHRPRSAPNIKSRYGLVARPGATRVPVRVSSNALDRRAAALRSVMDTEFGSRLSKCSGGLANRTLAEATDKYMRKDLRFCEKHNLVPAWSAKKLRPSFSINAFPLLTSLVATQASQEVIKPVPVDFPTKVRIPSFSRPKQGRNTLKDGEIHAVLRKAEKDGMERFLTRVKEIRQARITQDNFPVYTRSLVLESSAEVRPVNVSKGHLRTSLKYRKELRPALPLTESALEVLGATIPQPPQQPEEKAPSPVSIPAPPPLPLAFESAEKTPHETGSQLGESGDNTPSSITHSQWPPPSLNPIVVVKISQGKNVTTSNTGLSLDVDSTSVTARSTELLEPRQPQSALPIRITKATTAPFGALFRGKKVKETAQPGVRFLREPSRTPTPNHFLAGRFQQK